MVQNIHPLTFKYLKNLKANNHKEWFDSNRDQYELVRKEFIDFVQSVLDELAKIDNSLEGQKAKDSVFRINRDVRFSKDKTPYKTNFSAVISSGGRKFTGAGFYISIEPGNKSYLGGGIWQPETKMLSAIRQEIDYNFVGFKKIILKKTFAETFPELYKDSLKTMPRGYEIENPAAEFLKLKSFVYGSSVKDSVVNSDKYFKQIVSSYKTILPFFNFLKHAVS